MRQNEILFVAYAGFAETVAIRQIAIAVHRLDVASQASTFRAERRVTMA